MSTRQLATVRELKQARDNLCEQAKRSSNVNSFLRLKQRLFTDTETFLLYGCIGTILSIVTYSKLLSIFMLMQPMSSIIGLDTYQILLSLVISLVISFLTTAIIVEKLRHLVIRC